MEILITKITLFYCVYFILLRIEYAGLEILCFGIYYSESLTHLNLSHCKLNDESGTILAKALTTNEICQVRLSFDTLFFKQFVFII